MQLGVVDDSTILLNRFGIEAEHHKRLAREIHDTVATHVVSANLLLNEVRSRTRDQDIQDSLEELYDELSNALRDLRSFCFLLDEPAMCEEEWQLTLSKFVNGFARRAKLHLTFDFRVSGLSVATPIQCAVLRIVQEALVNVARHASAQQVSVRVFADGRQLVLEISDDGVGLPPMTTPGVGFGSMVQRSKEVNGTCHISSASDGTTIAARFPLS